MDDECIHGLVGCAPCQGLDEASGPNERATGTDYVFWSDEEKAIARNLDFTTSQAAARLPGRTVRQVSAYRIEILKMKDWAGYKPHPHK